MILSGAFILTLFVLSGAKVVGTGKDVFRQADFSGKVGGEVMGGSVFWLTDIELTWEAANADCAKHDGKLASLNTQRKIDFVTSKMREDLYSRKTWIGAKCRGCSSHEDISSDKWFWESGDQLFVANKRWGIKDMSMKQCPYDDYDYYYSIGVVIVMDMYSHNPYENWIFVNYFPANKYYGLCEFEV